MFITKSTDLSVHTSNEDIGYRILFSFGHNDGFIKKPVSSKICDSKYLDVDMVCDCLGRDLKEALTFQKNLTNGVIEALEIRFVINNLMNSFKIFSLANMPTKQIE